MNYVLGFVFSMKENFVLLQKKSHPEWQKDKYNGIGGKIEVGESEIDAMSRESLEEVGLTLRWEKKAQFFVNEHTVYVFKANAEPKMIKALIDFSKTTDEPCALEASGCLPDTVLSNVPLLIGLCRCPELGFAHLLMKGKAS